MNWDNVYRDLIVEGYKELVPIDAAALTDYLLQLNDKIETLEKELRELRQGG